MTPQILQHAPAGVSPPEGRTGATHATSLRRLDEMVSRLREGAAAFARLSLAERIALAGDMQAGYVRIAEASVRASCAAKGIPLGTAAEGEEWVSPWCVIRHLRLVIASLRSLQRTGNTPIGAVGRTVDERLAVGVFPAGPVDGVLFSGITVDVHLQPGLAEADMHVARAALYKQPVRESRTVLVLGAGNMNAIPAMDVISKLFNEGKSACSR